MSNTESPHIHKAMIAVVKEGIKQAELRNTILAFIEYQARKGFPFGELTLLHYNMLNGTNTDEIYSVAAAVELLILSFDILDDFEDGDCLDKPWCLEPNLALNTTTALSFLSASVIRNTSFENIDGALSLLLDLASRSIHGQHRDLLNICQTEAEYIDMTTEKSGSLVAFACLVGAILARKDYPVEIEVYSKYIGLIGQINNDLEDIETLIGKSDLINKKYTLPIIYLIKCKDEDEKFVQDYYDGNIDKIEIIKNRKLIAKQFEQTGALAYTEVIKRVYQNKALAQLHGMNIDRYYYDQLLKYIL